MPSSHSNTIPHSLGQLQKFSATTDGWIGETTFGKFQIKIYSSTIIRVWIYRDTPSKDFSYAVIAQPQKINVTVNEQTDVIVLSTPDLTLTIHRSPVRFTFSDKSGVLNEDETGLGTSWIGEQVTTYKKLQEGERFIGLGEKTGALDRKGHGYQNWTTDAYAYHGGQDPLYCSTPFYIGVHHASVYGIYLDNSHKTFFNFGASNNRFSSFAADAGDMNYYFIAGGSVANIISGYTFLTGRMELPPQWSIGYQQCRYSYYPDKEVITLANTFREKDIPADVIVLDIHYMDKYKIFTWDPKHFPEPKALMDQLRKMGFHVVVMCDPGIKKENGYAPYEDGVSKDVFLKYPDGQNYEGQVWPGWCHFPDFTKAETRAWWANHFNDYVNLGIDGFWNDMNEIATWGNVLPDNIVFDFDGNPTSTRQGRNVFGFQMARATFEGTKALLKGKRPFNLTRSGFSGVQRYAAVWTGDNVSYEEHMLLGVRLVNSLGLTGIAFAGYDVGGFVGDANSKLYARWISIGALSPFFRGHTMINSRDSEPWSFGEEVEQIARNYVKLRYQLMPYLYSLFYDAAQRGIPVQRSLAIDYTFVPQVYDHQFHNQYLFGPSILVAPTESNKSLLRVFLPSGEWYYLFDGRKFAGDSEVIIDSPIHRLPVFVKAGSVIPAHRPGSHTGEKKTELILHVYFGTNDSSFTLYEDDGDSYEYEKGNFMKRDLVFRGAENKLTITASQGKYTAGYERLKIVFHAFPVQTVSINGTSHPLHEHSFSFFTPIEKYDPVNEPESMGEETVKDLEVPYSSNEVQITW